MRGAAAAALLLPLAACTSGTGVSIADDKPGERAGDGGPATVTVTPHGEDAEAGEPVTVTASRGTLASVTVTDAEGHSLTGQLSADGTHWASRRKAVPGTSYTVTAVTTTEAGGKKTVKSAFTTAEVDRVNKVDWRPGAGATVGVAQPVSLVFDHPVTDKAAVERQLQLTTSNGTEGTWAWLKDYSGRDRIDWRPEEYWKPGTEVTLTAELNGTDSGEGGWFVRDYSTHFTIGTDQVVTVDLDRKQLTLTRDGQEVRTIPVSGGTPGGDKRSWRGTAVLMAKEGTIRMNSETVGLGDAYDKMVDYSMRLTWSGMYAHAAPWNDRWMGKANKSSGCIGMSDADAAWFYAQVRPGDPFEIKGEDTKGVVTPGNGFGAWNLSWTDWQARSALR
ncbi:L,D-transpeptidase [Streptomyces sp. WMMC897]|uniref:L,D-transpeptidase n=1 Tax=Streptomyces sp. WMMC897 TaxID=3014782 RepID=UPI0022B6D657|nr:Ig-like domain-containing protein [Streptomyces sp. WMMC897]MCZ7414211.1 Ig-like domain-containing protein [Streptomyces sp. WMMC897]